MKKLAIITTHPIQYNAPVYKLLAERQKLQVKVFYTWEKGGTTFDRGFGKEVQWDIPLLEGYDYEFIYNNGNNGRGFWDIRNLTLIKSIEFWKADAVLIFGWNYYSHLKAILHFKNKIPVLFRGDSTLIDEEQGLKTMIRRLWLIYVYKHIDVGLYVGMNNKIYYLKHGVKNGALYFAPHAIDNDRFKNFSAYEAEVALQDKLSLEAGTVVFLFAGKFEEKKNPLLLIEAFKQLKGYNISLLIVGNGKLEKEVREAVSGDIRIKLLPFQNQTIMPLIYKLSDVFVLPSKGPGETWGLAVNEAMACGRPVIASNKVGCAPDLVKEGITGFVFRTEDIEDLKEKLLSCLDRQTRRKMGVEAEKHISDWSFDNIAMAIENSVTQACK